MNPCRTILLPLIGLLLLAGDLSAQNQIGLEPPSVKRKYIETPIGKVIYPEGCDSLAFRSARIMRHLQLNDTSILGPDQVRKVPVIIRNLSSLPAGFSTPAPWRNEYYITPPYNAFLGPTDWLAALTAHEYRHAQQFHAARRKWGILYRILMGETGWLFNSLLTQPLWFREGDAVLAETLFSKAGRGRLPSFHMEYRALRASGRHFSYEKAHFGSFRDFVPNPYRLGYYMVTKARRDHGELVWTGVLQDTYRKGFLWPFSRSLKKATGHGTRGLYRAAMAELDSLWSPASQGRSTSGASPIEAERTRMFTSFRYPHYSGDGSVIALGSGFDRIPAFVQFRVGKLKELFKMGVYSDDHSRLVIEGDRMCWAESAFHERWTAVDYSVVKVHDLRSGRTRRIGKRTRWFSPAIAPDGERIVVSETDPNYAHRLLLIDAASGEILKELKPADRVQRTHMRFTRDGRSILAVAIGEEGNALIRIDAVTGAELILIPFTSIPLATPIDLGKFVLFSAGAGGNNNIHAIDTSDGSIHRITNEPFGAFDPMPSADGSKLLFSTYTADGYRVMELPIDTSAWPPADLEIESDLRFHESAVEFEGDPDPEDNVTLEFHPERFRGFTSGMLKLYGWFPAPDPPEYGLELYTQNVMSTLRGTIGIAYNTNEDRMRYSARLAYAGIYPVLDLEFVNGGRRISRIARTDSTLHEERTVWTENMISGGMSFLFNLTQGSHITQLAVGGRYEYFDLARKDTLDENITIGTENFSGWRADVSFSRLQPQARRQVKPRWGQQITAQWRAAFDGDALRQVVSGSFFFPGLLRTHSFNLQGSWRRENVIGTYRYLDDRLMPHGLSPRPFEHIAFGTINYELPLWYPDLSAGPIAILHRIRLNAFAGNAEAVIADRTDRYAFAGGELMFDLRLLRLFQATVLLRATAAITGDLDPDLPFQFLVTRFEFAN